MKAKEEIQIFKNRAFKKIVASVGRYLLARFVRFLLELAYLFVLIYLSILTFDDPSPILTVTFWIIWLSSIWAAVYLGGHFGGTPIIFSIFGMIYIKEDDYSNIDKKTYIAYCKSLIFMKYKASFTQRFEASILNNDFATNIGTKSFGIIIADRKRYKEFIKDELDKFKEIKERYLNEREGKGIEAVSTKQIFHDHQ